MKQGPVVSGMVNDGYRCDLLKAYLGFNVYQLAVLQKLNLVSFGNKSDLKQCGLISGTTTKSTIILSCLGTYKAFQILCLVCSSQWPWNPRREGINVPV